MIRRQKGTILIEVIIDLVVLTTLVFILIDCLALWVVREKARASALGAHEIMLAVREYYLDGDVETERWPIDVLGIDNIQVLIDSGYLRDDINPTPYGGNYILGNGAKRIALYFYIDDKNLGPYIALNIPEHGRWSGTTITASMPRPNVHRNHDELLPINGSRYLNGTLDINGHNIINVGEFLRVDGLNNQLIHPSNNPEDYGYFPDDENIAIAFANTTTIIGRWPSTNGNSWKVVNGSADTARNHVIPLRTEKEWESFRDNLVPRKSELMVCEITNTVDNSCAAAQPETLYVRASETNLVSGSSIGLTWSAQNMGNCVLYSSVNSTEIGVSNGGGQTYIMTQTITFYLKCRGTYTNQTQTDLVTVNVTQPHVHTGWWPSTNTVCNGADLTQHATCHPGVSRWILGTNTTGIGTWRPPPSGVCSGQSYYQYETCGFQRAAIGTYQANWTPVVSTVCSGTPFTQNSACGSQSAIGTKIGTWSPAASTQCAGLFFTQTSSCGVSRSIKGTNTANQSTVNGYYSLVFGRSGDTGGLCHWAATITNGTWSISSFVWGARGTDCPAGSAYSKSHSDVPNYETSVCETW